MRNLLKEAIELLEKDERPEAESWKERAEEELRYFPISLVCREDLEGEGYNTQDTDDHTMENIANKMGDVFSDTGYWEALEVSADRYEIPKHNAEPLKCVAEGCEDLQGEDGEYCKNHYREI